MITEVKKHYLMLFSLALFPAPAAAAPEAVPQKAAEPVVEKEIIGK